MSSKEKSTAAIRKEDSKKEDNLKKGKELTEPTTIIVKKMVDEKKEMKYEIINVNFPETEQKGRPIAKKEEGQNKQEKLTEDSNERSRNTTEEGNSSTDIQIINESQFDIEIKKRNYYSKSKKQRNSKKEKVKKRVTKKKSKCSKPKRKENKANKAKREFAILKIQRLDDIILNFEKLFQNIKENDEEEKSQKSSSLTKESNEKKDNFLGKKRKNSDTQSKIEENEKIISSEEIEKASNPEGPIQNNNDSFVVPKILQSFLQISKMILMF